MTFIIVLVASVDRSTTLPNFNMITGAEDSWELSHSGLVAAYGSERP